MTEGFEFLILVFKIMVSKFCLLNQCKGKILYFLKECSLQNVRCVMLDVVYISTSFIQITSPSIM